MLLDAAAPALSLGRTPAEQEASLELWRYGPGGWQLVSRDLPGDEEDAPQTAATTPHAWYYFTALVRHGDGSWSHMDSPEWAEVWDTGNSAPTIEITHPATADEHPLGQELGITWDAQDADGDPMDVYLWAFSWDTGWRQISGRLDAGEGQFLWDTAADWATEGWYCFGAWVTDGGEWRATTSRDWVHLVQPQPDPSDSTTFSAELVAGVLWISGTDGSETITVRADGDQLNVQHDTQTWDFPASLSGITIYGFDGDDVIRITHEVAVGVTVYAGDGDDRVYAAGTGSDALHGDLGDDLLISVGGGADTVGGEDGFDSFWVDGADTIHDASPLEQSRTSVHTISAFYAAYTDDPSSPDYVPLEIAGQDLTDPAPTSSRYDYKDFSDRPLFVGTPGIPDVRQGYIGDCYFLASLASLTLTDVHFIEQMVTELGDGTYAVRFYDDGSPQYVRVDAELPTFSAASYSLVYADTGPDGQIWVPIVEKAYAHFRYGLNTYASLQAGWMSTVYTQVTNTWARNNYIFNMTQDQVWALLSAELSQGHAVTLASIGQPPTPIVGGHAYTVYCLSEESGTRYVTVHNPWGVDGQSWDSNYSDGLLKLTVSKFLSCFSYAVACQA